MRREREESLRRGIDLLRGYGQMLEWMGQIHVLRKFAFAYPTKVFWLGERLVERVGRRDDSVKTEIRSTTTMILKLWWL